MSFALSNIALQLRNLYTHPGNDGDFTLNCQGRDIKAHSFILKMRSELFQLFFHNLNKLHIFRCKYFETFLTTAIGEHEAREWMEVTEFSFEVLSTAVEFMYGIEIPETFNNSQDLRSLLHLSDFYLMDDLKAAVGSIIGRNLKKENILENIQLAEQFRAALLSDKCASFLLDDVYSSFPTPPAVKKEELRALGGSLIYASLAKEALKVAKKQ